MCVRGPGILWLYLVVYLMVELVPCWVSVYEIGARCLVRSVHVFVVRDY